MLFNKIYASNPRLVDKQVKPFSRVFIFAIVMLYVFYGFFNRDPWKNEDVIGFASILKLINTPFLNWNSTISLLPWNENGTAYYLFSAFISKIFIFLSVRVDHAVRIGAILLVLTTIYCIWKSVFILCLNRNFAPYEYPLGGQPEKDKYAKCMADISVLLFCGCIGAILRIHETTPFILGMCINSFVCYIIVDNLKRNYHKHLKLAFNILCFLILIYANYNSSYLNNPNGFSFQTVLERLNVMVVQYPTFTWPLVPFAIFAFLCWYNQSIMQKLMLINLIAILVFIFDSKLHQGYFLYALPSLCILASLAFAKMPTNIHKIIIGFNIILFSFLLFSLWIIWVCWQNNIYLIKYLYYVNHDITLSAIIFATCATLLWFSTLYIYRNIVLEPPIWLSPYLMASGLTISWVVIVHLWLPAVNQIKTYRYVFNTINLYVNDSCVSVHDLQAPQMASLSYMAKFKVGNNCKFTLSYMPYTKNLLEITPPNNSVLVWQGRRLLDKDESFYLWKSVEDKNTPL
ncbi:MAG: hypothetical protein RLZZ210_262 [Pseudomonadota bacterium]